MDLSSLHLSPASIEAIQGLRLQIELASKKNIRIQKTVEELIALLKVAKKTENPYIRKALTKFSITLDSTQLSFFENLDIDLSPREKLAPEPAPPKAPSEEEQNLGKKKVVYRGQVTWV